MTREFLVTGFFPFSFFLGCLETVPVMVTSEAEERGPPGDSSLDFLLLASEGGGEPLDGSSLDSRPPDEAAASLRIKGGEDLEVLWAQPLSSFWPSPSVLECSWWPLLASILVGKGPLLPRPLPSPGCLNSPDLLDSLLSQLSKKKIFFQTIFCNFIKGFFLREIY
jgi:hypothetical protein